MKTGFFKVAILASLIAVSASLAFAWGEHTFIRTIQTQTMLIRHKATEEQRRVAESNAKAFFSQLTPAKKQELKKNKIHAVLIRTTRSTVTSPAAKEVRMRYSLEGEVLIEGVLAGREPPYRLRRRIGYVFQEVGLFPHLSVAENIAITPKLLGQAKAEREARADELLDLVYRHAR